MANVRIFNIVKEIITKIKKLSSYRKSELLNLIDDWLLVDEGYEKPEDNYENDHSGIGAYSNDVRTYTRRNIVIEVTFDKNGRLFKEQTKDVSGGGMFIKTRRHRQFDLGHKISLVFMLPGSEKPIKIDGEIVRIASDGMAVKFDDDTTYKSILIESELSSISDD